MAKMFRATLFVCGNREQKIQTAKIAAHQKFRPLSVATEKATSRGYQYLFPVPFEIQSKEIEPFLSDICEWVSSTIFYLRKPILDRTNCV